MDAPSSSVDGGPPKRLLPSRQRRATTGILGSEVDIMILEAYKHKGELKRALPYIPNPLADYSDFMPAVPETERLIEDTTPFELTTNSARAESSVEHGRVVKPVVQERYFNRPEVIRAYQQQIDIQTPTFSNMKDVLAVSSRTRFRNNDQQAAVQESCSDAVFLARHRKYEVFEKGIRLREKEKLQYDHYKLKERIEHLRSMEGSAFLTLPASYFTNMPGVKPGEDMHSHPGVHVNGAVAHNEGERRREEMLQAGLYLEERYRTLLPPDRVSKKTVKTLATEPPVAIEPEFDPALPPLPLKETHKLKFPKAPSASSSSTRSPSYVQPGSDFSVPNKKLKVSHPTPTSSATAPIPAKRKPSQLSAVSTPPPPPPSITIRPSRPETPIDVVSETPTTIMMSDIRTVIPAPPPQPAPPSSLHEPPFGDARVVFPPPEFTEAPESISVAKPSKKYTKSKKKKGRRSSITRAPSMPSIETISPSTYTAQSYIAQSPAPSTASKAKRAVSAKSRPACLLVLAAHRNVSTRDRAPRNVNAFGTKLPATFSDSYEYELPASVYQPPEKLTMTGREPDGSDESDMDDEEEIDELDPSQQPEEHTYICQEPEQFEPLPPPPFENGYAKMEASSISRPPSPFHMSSEPTREEVESEDEDDESHRMQE